MTLEVLPEAITEVIEAANYLDQQVIGLGDEFIDQVAEACGRIIAHPTGWHPVTRKTRRCMLKQFSYGVVYQVRNDRILVIAIAHTSRKPRYWTKRVPR